MTKKENPILTYNEIAEVYDLFNKQGVKKDIEVLQKICENYNVDCDTASIIDIGAGTGRLTIPLAKITTGQVIHVEPSREMLKQAQKKMAKEKGLRIQFIEKQWEELHQTLIKKTDLIIAMEKVFHYMNTREQQEQALQNAYSLLKKQGILVLDLFYFPGLILQTPLHNVIEKKQGKRWITRHSRHRIDYEQELFILEDTYYILNEEKQVMDFMQNQHLFSIFTKREVKALLEATGFHNVQVFEGNTYGLAELRFLVVAQKP